MHIKTELLSVIIIFFNFICFGCKTNQPIPTEPKLILYLPFNGNAIDESDNGNNASIINATLTTDRNGINNSAYYFDGIKDFIQIPNSSSLSFPKSGITISAWIYVNQWDKNWAPILVKSNVSNLGMYGMMLTNFSGSKQLEVRLNNNYVNKDYVFLTGSWYFTVFTWDGSTCKYYVNGNLIGTKNHNVQIVSDDLPLVIGKDIPQLIEYLNGKLDDIRIYDKAISETQVDSLYRLSN